MLLYSHFEDEQILHVKHRLNEVMRTIALKHFLDSRDWLQFVRRQEHLEFMKIAHLRRLPHSH
jgi:hypothetical protein